MADRKKLEDRLATKLAELKAARVGKGRDGSWAPFVKGQLNLPLRTVDRWVRKKLASGDLPEWVAQKLTANKPKPRRQVKNGQVESNVQQNRQPAHPDQTDTPKCFADWSELTKDFVTGLPKIERRQTLVKAIHLLLELSGIRDARTEALRGEPHDLHNANQAKGWTYDVKEDGTTEFSRSESPFDVNPTLMAPIVERTPEELAKH